jgi:hypothetical protein
VNVISRPILRLHGRRGLLRPAEYDRGAANETKQTPAIERFIETPTALIMQYEDEIEPDPERSPQSYVSQILSGHRPFGKEAAYKTVLNCLSSSESARIASFSVCLKRPRR